MTENLRKSTEFEIMITYNSVPIIENNFCSDALCLIPLVVNFQSTLFISSLFKLSFRIKTNLYYNYIFILKKKFHLIEIVTNSTIGIYFFIKSNDLIS